MLQEQVSVEQKGKCPIYMVVVLAILSAMMIVSSMYLNIKLVQQIQDQTQIQTNLQSQVQKSLSQASNKQISPFESNITLNISKPNKGCIKNASVEHIIYTYKKMFEYANLLHSMLDKSEDCEYLREFVDYITVPVYITEVSNPDKDVYKEIFLLKIKQLVREKLSKDEQRIIIYLHDFVNLYCSLEF